MAKRSQQAQMIFDALEPLIGELGFDLVDVVYARENGKLFLRLLVDKRGGITIDECALINETVDPVIDNELKLSGHDYFEVSSPGLLRPLTTPADFARYADEEVEVRLYRKIDQQKLFCGVLRGGTETDVTIFDGEAERTFALADVAKISRTIRFD